MDGLTSAIEHTCEFRSGAENGVLAILFEYKFSRHSVSFSVLPALSTDGIIYSDIKVGSWNGEDFLGFLDGLLKNMNVYPGPRSVLVMDNCSVHHIPDVTERCEAK
jgi:hypothetical protein